MSKILDLEAYRNKLDNATDDNEILMGVVEDASKEVLTNAIWIAKDLDIDITDLNFIALMSSMYHYYHEGMLYGFGLHKEMDDNSIINDNKLIHAGVQEWCEQADQDKEGDDE